jgi:hypothetical protein
VVGKSVHTNIKQTASGQTLYNLQHLLCGDFAIVFFLFFNIVLQVRWLNQSISGKLVSTVLPNNPRL